MQMNVCVIGAAGRTGAHLVTLAAADGHAVTAVARSVGRVVPGAARVVQGDVADPRVAREAVAGAHVVVCAVAAAGRGADADVATPVGVVVDAMRDTGVRRLVVTSSRNLVATKPRLFVVPTRWWLRHVYADLERMERLVTGSGLDWTIARATRLADEPPRGSVWTDRERDATGGDWKLPRADYARALLDLATDPAEAGQVVGINGAARR